jgi:bifunctional enzyme CysN/CysC
MLTLAEIAAKRLSERENRVIERVGDSSIDQSEKGTRLSEREKKPGARSSHEGSSSWNVSRHEHEVRNAHKACVVWFTGYSGAGKTTLATALERRLFDMGLQTVVLDGDQVRKGLCSDLGFSAADRAENIRRVGEVASLMFEAGHVVLCSFISPYAQDRHFVRSLIPEGSFFEIYVRCGLEVCIQRDPRGSYAKALRGEISDFTGVSSPYEPPADPELVAATDLHPVETIVGQLLKLLLPALLDAETSAR